MNGLFMPDEEEDTENKKQVIKTYHANYLLLTIFAEQKPNSLGDINIFSKGALSQLTEPLRNAQSPSFERLALFELNYKLDSLFPFSIKDRDIFTFRQVNDNLANLIKSEL
jgi:hypothetical protein